MSAPSFSDNTWVTTWGERRQIEFTATLNGEPVDLQGKDLVFTAKVRLADTDEDAVIRLTVGDGLTISGEDNEVVTATLSRELVTGELAAYKDSPSLYCDLWNRTDDVCLGKGKLTVKASVNRGA